MKRDKQRTREKSSPKLSLLIFRDDDDDDTNCINVCARIKPYIYLFI